MIGLSAVCGMALISWVAVDYQRLRRSIDDSEQLTRTIAHQRDEIVQHRMQIQAFAQKINALKDHLVKLDYFEKKIRVIANLEAPEGNDNLFGVGGVTPDDLDSDLEPSQRHEDLMRDMHQQIDDLDMATTRKELRLSSLMEKLEIQRHLLASTPAIRPASGWMTSRFGHRTSPFTGRREFHKGVDIANRSGTAVLATADGVVSFAGKKGHMGTIVVIDHGHGLVTRYAHLGEMAKQPGETVKRGEIIARMGNSGRSTGPHLHYEVHLNGVPVNPVKYILN